MRLILDKAALALVLVLAFSTNVQTFPLRRATELAVLHREVQLSGQFLVRVPQDFPTIQAAIDAAAEGGTVLIGPGLYKENVQITKSLRVVGVGQEQVQIQAANDWQPIIHVLSKIPIQVYFQGLTVGDPTLSLEQVLQLPPPPGPPALPPYTGLFVEGPIQTLMRQATVGGLGGGIQISGILRDIPFEEYIPSFFQPSAILEEVRLMHNGVGLILSDAQVLIIRSVIEENFDGIWGFFKGSLFLHHSVVRRNQQAGVNLSIRDGPYLLGHISDNEIAQNGVGVYLAAWKEGSWIEISENRFVQNQQYAVVVQDPACPYVLNFVPKEIPSRPIQILGSANEFRENTKGDLCPPDYPWPPGFRK